MKTKITQEEIKSATISLKSDVVDGALQFAHCPWDRDTLMTALDDSSAVKECRGSDVVVELSEQSWLVSISGDIWGWDDVAQNWTTTVQPRDEDEIMKIARAKWANLRPIDLLMASVGEELSRKCRGSRRNKLARRDARVARRAMSELTAGLSSRMFPAV